MQTIETERLVLRAWRLADAGDVYAYAKNPNVGPNAGWPPHKSVEESREIVAGFIQADETWAIVPRESGRVAGSIGLHPDTARKGLESRMLGYVLDEAQWGKGLATEAARAVVRYAFETMGLEVLAIHHYPHNTRSRRVIEKCGFVYEGTTRRAVRLFDGLVRDRLSYSLLREEYLRQRG